MSIECARIGPNTGVKTQTRSLVDASQGKLGFRAEDIGIASTNS